MIATLILLWKTLLCKLDEEAFDNFMPLLLQQAKGATATIS